MLTIVTIVTLRNPGVIFTYDMTSKPPGTDDVVADWCIVVE